MEIEGWQGKQDVFAIFCISWEDLYIYTCTRVKHGSGFITITFSVVRKAILRVCVHAALSVTLAGGVGFDINCGVRLIRTNLSEKDVSPVKEQLAQVLTYMYTHVEARNLSCLYLSLACCHVCTVYMCLQYV